MSRRREKSWKRDFFFPHVALWFLLPPAIIIPLAAGEARTRPLHTAPRKLSCAAVGAENAGEDGDDAEEEERRDLMENVEEEMCL